MEFILQYYVTKKGWQSFVPNFNQYIIHLTYLKLITKSRLSVFTYYITHKTKISITTHNQLS